ncbi:MAG: NUDIX hydrolase [Caldilineaceae bacterium]
MPYTTPITLPRRYPPAPLVGVAAIVFNEQGHALLVERGRPPSQGQWSLPGGLLDLGEDLRSGVHREVREECGVDIEIGGLVDVFEPILRDDEDRVEYHYVVIDFWARYLHGDPCAEDDAADIGWVPLDQLSTLPMRQDTHNVIHKAHGLWLAAQS